MNSFTPENPGFLILPALSEGEKLPPLPGQPAPPKTIVIDPGHGGDDPGTQGNGIYEKDGTLPISKALAKELRDRKYNVIMTREEDITLSREARGRIGNEPGRLCFISIHLNHSDSPKSTGIETFYAWPKRIEVLKELRIRNKANKSDDFEDQRGRLLAEAIHAGVLATTHATDREVKNNPALYVLNSTLVPSVLVECGFVSNKGETDKLRSEEYQTLLAKGIADGLETYLRACEANPNYGIVLQSPKASAEKK